MRILICAATPTEAIACQSGIRKAGFERDFEVLRIGVGLANADDALAKRLRRAPKPALIISSGFAGSLDSKLPVGSWAVASRLMVIDADDPHVLRAIAVSKLRTNAPDAVPCSMISAANLTHQSQINRAMIQHVPGPIAVDMETAALAEQAEEHGIAFMALRLVTDSPEEPLPGFLGPIASALASQDLVAKVSFGVEGLRKALFDPRGVVRLVKNSPKWASNLRKRWSDHAATIARNID